MKKSAKTLTTVTAVVFLMASLTACASPRDGITTNSSDSSYTEPLKAGSDGYTGYKVDYVDVSDGEVVKCLTYGKNTSAAVISCDWENPIQK